MIKLTVRAPANNLNIILAQDSTEFLTTRGLIAADSLKDEATYPSQPDLVQYRAYCRAGTWYTIVYKESI